MKIIVCIKQVPDTNDVKWSKENNIIREGLISILNPYDEYAVQMALDLKRKNKNIEITLLSMGPNQAKDVLEYGIAMGADNGILLSDKRFQGSDTVATSNTLYHAIKKYLPDFDLIVCGQFAIDGDTAQTGPSLASKLNIPVIGYVRKIIKADTKKTVVECASENEITVYEIKNPSLICVLKDTVSLYKPKIDDYIRAQNKKIDVYNLDDIEIDAHKTGIKGSPTFVYKAFRPEIKKECKFLYDNYTDTIKKCLKDWVNE